MERKRRRKEGCFIYIDELKAFLEKFLGLVGEKVPDGVLGGSVGLVNVNALSRAKHIRNGSVASVYS